MITFTVEEIARLETFKKNLTERTAKSYVSACMKNGTGTYPMFRAKVEASIDYLEQNLGGDKFSEFLKSID